MRFSKHPIPSSWCWKLANVIPITKNLRWHVGRQYHSDLGCYNHPFWVHLQKKFLWWWVDVAEIEEPFYPEEGDTLELFMKHVASILSTNKYLITQYLPS